MSLEIYGAVVLVVVLAVVVGEGFRQRRRARRAGESVSGRPSILAPGALELQRLLQPDRKVEIVRDALRDRDRVDPDHRPSRPADGSDDDGSHRDGSGAGRTRTERVTPGERAPSREPRPSRAQRLARLPASPTRKRTSTG